MNSVIVSDYGVMLAKKGERLVIRGPKPRLELYRGRPTTLFAYRRQRQAPYPHCHYF
jgi:hypothetical protein